MQDIDADPCDQQESQQFPVGKSDRVKCLLIAREGTCLLGSGHVIELGSERAKVNLELADEPIHLGMKGFLFALEKATRTVSCRKCIIRHVTEGGGRARIDLEIERA
jgi:hypothetical protein